MLAELAVDFPALRARAHISGLRPVDYGPVGPVDTRAGLAMDYAADAAED